MRLGSWVRAYCRGWSSRSPAVLFLVSYRERGEVGRRTACAVSYDGHARRVERVQVAVGMDPFHDVVALGVLGGEVCGGDERVVWEDYSGASLQG
jgi:hypothetical protein